LSKLNKTCEQFLDAKNCVLWPGVAFNLKDEDGRRRAAEWLAGQVRGVAEFRHEEELVA
jgi:hypothetical protein